MTTNRPRLLRNAALKYGHRVFKDEPSFLFLPYQHIRVGKFPRGKLCYHLYLDVFDTFMEEVDAEGGIHSEITQKFDIPRLYKCNYKEWRTRVGEYPWNEDIVYRNMCCCEDA